MLQKLFFKRLKRGPQVVLEKDFGAIISLTGLQSGDVVIDAGSGSGFLAIRLGSIVAPQGKVYSFEWRDDFAELARKNVEKAGLSSVVEIAKADAFAGFPKDGADLVTPDFAGSDKAVPHAFAALKSGGWCVGILPNAEQMRDFYLAGGEAGFEPVHAIDVTVKNWLVRPHGCRPETMGLNHTAFLVFLQKPVQPNKLKPSDA